MGKLTTFYFSNFAPKATRRFHRKPLHFIVHVSVYARANNGGARERERKRDGKYEYE